MKIYIAMIEDHHDDVQVKPFSKQYDAQEYLNEYVEDLGYEINEEELTQDMIADGWIFLGSYGIGDYVRIVERELI